MKLLIVGSAEPLIYELIGKTNEFDHFTTTKDAIGTEFYDAVVIQDTEVEPFELKHIVGQLPETKIFYAITYDIKQAIIDTKNDICKELNITAIQPKLSASQIADIILLHVLGQIDSGREKKVVTFLGTHAQNGQSQTVFGTAAKLKELTDYSVVVLSLTSSNPQGLYFQGTMGITLNELYTQISNNRSVIKSKDLKNLLYEDSKGFYYLAGNQDFTKRNHYHIDDIEYLIDMLIEEFDIVLIDAGHDPDTTLTIQALQKADLKLLNTTQQPLGSLLWKKMNEDILGRYLNISPNEFMMIVNMYSPDVPKRDIKALEFEFGVPEIARIPDCGIEGIMCEINRTLLYDTTNSSYKKNLQEAYHKLSMHILQRFDLLGENKEQEKKPWWKLLLAR